MDSTPFLPLTPKIPPPPTRRVFPFGVTASPAPNSSAQTPRQLPEEFSADPTDATASAVTKDEQLFKETQWFNEQGNYALAIQHLTAYLPSPIGPQCKIFLTKCIAEAEGFLQNGKGPDKFKSIAQALKTSSHMGLKQLGYYYLLRGEIIAPQETRLSLSIYREPTQEELSEFPEIQKAHYFLSLKGCLGQSARMGAVCTIVGRLLKQMAGLHSPKPTAPAMATPVN